MLENSFIVRQKNLSLNFVIVQSGAVPHDTEAAH